MEINLQKEELTETSAFSNFSIRKYVAETRKKDKKKCWPFGSLGDPENDEDFESYQSAESTYLSCKKSPGDVGGSDDTPEYTEAPNSSKIEVLKGNEDRSETTTDMIAFLGTNDNLGKGLCNGSSESASNKVNSFECQHENSVKEGAKSGSSGDADHNYEPRRHQPQKNTQKFRLLSDILSDLSGPSCESFVNCDRKNMNIRFATQTEDELDDDVTLDAFFRKGNGVEEPRLVQDKGSKNRFKDSHVGVNSRLAIQTEDELDDNVTLDVVFRKRKGVEVTLPLKKQRRTIRVEEPRLVQDKNSKCGSEESHGNDSEICPRIHSIKTRIDDLDTQTMRKGKKHAEKVIEMQKDFKCQKSRINAEVSSMEAKGRANNDSEMEAVMLLARHFNEEKPSTDNQTPVELETGTGCACVQKKLREQLNEPISTFYTETSTKPATKDPVFADTSKKKFMQEKLENAYCSAQVNDMLKVAEHRSSYMPSKGTTASIYQSHIEICLMKAHDAQQNYSTLVCSVNRNPADFSIPNAENNFMRGG